MLISIILFVFLVSFPVFEATSWYCVELQSTVLVDGIIWKTENCTNDANTSPLLTVNSIAVDLAKTNGNYRVIPAVASSNTSLQTLPDMATQKSFIAGINGGYFWRVDISGIWIDDVCRGKTRKEAEQPASEKNANFGVSDGLIKVDGQVLGNNCNCSGYSRPAVLELSGEDSTIEVLYRGETVGKDVTNAIGAGPNLVSFNATSSESYIDIPSDDDNINILEHAANTAVGLQFNKVDKKAMMLTMVTTDGSDECGPRDITCGLNSKDLASLMKDHFSSSVAMSMDQGGSTTMWVKGANPDRNGVVSRSHNTEPVDQDGPRNIANGLFIEVF
eukprot:gene15555-21004_t